MIILPLSWMPQAHVNDAIHLEKLQPMGEHLGSLEIWTLTFVFWSKLGHLDCLSKIRC